MLARQVVAAVAEEVAVAAAAAVVEVEEAAAAAAAGAELDAFQTRVSSRTFVHFSRNSSSQVKSSQVKSQVKSIPKSAFERNDTRLTVL